MPAPSCTRVCLQGGKGIQALKSLRTMRALRPLRLISRTEGVKECLDCIIAALPDIGQVSIVIILLSLWFSLFGVSLYSGAFYSCIELDSSNLSNLVLDFEWNNTATGTVTTVKVGDWLDCVGGAAVAKGAVWHQEELHFDEVGAGMR
jgi:hypothetical protein